MKISSQKKFFFSAFKLVLPFFVWTFLFRGFLSGQSLILHDTFELYANIKFYLNSLQGGVYPLWDPFQFWGAPFELRLLQFGPFNPFLFLTVLFNKLGLSFYQAFMCYFAMYYFLGLLGFYRLARSIFNDSLLAYLAYLFLMFSSFGMNIFTQIQTLFLYVPAVWYFYFLVEFCKEWRKSDLSGLTFSLMIILTTYVPFYWATVFILSFIFFAVIYFREFKALPGRFRKFCRKNIAAVSVCLFALAVSAAIPAMIYRDSRGSDYVIPSRHTDEGRILKDNLKMDYEEIKGGGAGVRMAFEDLFSGFREADFRNDGFIYFPAFVFIILFLSALTKMNKRALFFLGTGFTLFLISLGEAAVLHRFLFEHVFFFKLFRNIYFLSPFLLSIVFLYAAEQFALIINGKNILGGRPAFLAGAAVFLGSVFFFFLCRQEAVPVSSYLTVGPSLLFFALIFFKRLSVKSPSFFAALLILVLMQPLEVLSYYNNNARYFRSGILEKSIRQDTVSPRFSFTRPKQYVKDYQNGDSEHDPKYFLSSSSIMMQDSPGFITDHHGYPARWSYLLSQKTPEEDYREYVQHKFLLYDTVEFTPQKDLPLEGEAARLKNLVNPAWVFSPAGTEESPAENHRPSKAAVIGENSGIIEVLRFDANTLNFAVQLEEARFLVYNDSFHSGWRVAVNGKPQKLYRANIAFKGVWVPAGKSLISFSFYSPGRYALYFSVLALFFIFPAGWIFILLKERHNV